MSQLPNASYNPTANPVSTSVVPFQASVPQQIEIGGGTQQLGAAFSQFSQTLASFVANQVSTNREQAIEEGRLKAEKSRKSFRKLVESGEIKPEENPWEALGAAAGDAAMHAEKFKADTRAEYERKIMTDPNFASSMGGVEDFMNQRLQNELSVGMDNPVWQRTFMKEATPFMSSLSSVHGANVARNRRERIVTGMRTSIKGAVQDRQDELKNVPIDSPDRSVVNGRMRDRLQATLDEAVQTVGPDALDQGVKELVDILVLSGNDPELAAQIESLKSGTGALTKTSTWKAQILERQEIIQQAQERRDTDMAVGIYMRSLEDLEPLEFSDFAKEVRARIRPDMDETELSELYASTRKATGPVRDAMMSGFERNLMTDVRDALLQAYTPDGSGVLPQNSDMIVLRDKEILKQGVRRRLLDAQNRIGVPMDSDKLDKKVEGMIDTVLYETGQNLFSQTMNLPPDIRSQALVTFSDTTNIPVPGIGMVNEAAAAVTSLRSPEALATYSNTLLTGLTTYREAKNRGMKADDAGFNEGSWAFFGAMDNAVNRGMDAQTAANTAVNSVAVVGLRVPQETNNALFTAISRYDSANANKILEKAGPFYITYLMAAPGGLGAAPKQVELAWADWWSKNGTMVNGEPIVYSPSLPDEMRSPAAWEDFEGGVMLQLKKLEDSEVDRVAFQLAMDGHNYQVLVRDKGRETLRIPTLEEMEKMNEAGLPNYFGAKEAAIISRTFRVNKKDADVRESIRKNQWKMNRPGGFFGDKI